MNAKKIKVGATVRIKPHPDFPAAAIGSVGEVLQVGEESVAVRLATGPIFDVGCDLIEIITDRKGAMPEHA